MDYAVYHFFVGHRLEVVTDFLVPLTKASAPEFLIIYSLFIAMLGMFLMAYDHNYARLNWLLLPITVITAAVVSRTLKHVIDRPRPPLAGQLIYEFNPSMPSGHTVAAFAFVGSISFIWRKWWLIFLWILAVIIAVSRLYIGVHWLSDVVVGALVGLAVSYCVFVIWQRYVCHRFLVSDSNR